MTPENISTLLLINDNLMLLQALLFQIAKHFSCNGRRVLYIAPEPISALPPNVNDTEVLTDPEVMRLVSFMYFPCALELLKCLTAIHKIHKPPAVIIIQEMERYCREHDGSFLTAMLLNAASTCGYRLKTHTTLVASYKVPVPTPLIRNFFHNVWCIHNTQDNLVTLKNLSAEEPSLPVRFFFSLSSDQSNLILDKIFKLGKPSTNAGNVASV